MSRNTICILCAALLFLSGCDDTVITVEQDSLAVDDVRGFIPFSTAVHNAGALLFELPDGELTISAAGELRGGQRSHAFDVISELLPDGGRLLLVIKDKQAPDNFRFSVVAPPGISMLLQPDGGVSIADASGEEEVGRIDPPWAIDGAGRFLPTHFVLDGTDLVQHIELTEAILPVYADPKITWGIVTGTAYFTRNETSGVCAGGSPAQLLLSKVPGLVGVALQLHMAVIQAMACHAYSIGKCLKLKIPTFEPSTVKYGDRNCK